MNGEKLRAGWHKQNVEDHECVTCHGTFERRTRPKKGTSFGTRGKNTINCSKECTKIYNKTKRKK